MRPSRSRRTARSPGAIPSKPPRPGLRMRWTRMRAAATLKANVRLRNRSWLHPWLSWIGLVWTVLAMETLLSVWLWLSYRDVHSSFIVHLRQRDLLLGVPGEHPGIVQTLTWVNITLALALWLEHRSMWHRRAKSAAATTIAALAAALLLAAIVWSTFKLAEHYPALEASEVIGVPRPGPA